jgi:hypothetical protein
MLSKSVEHLPTSMEEEINTSEVWISVVTSYLDGYIRDIA